MTISEFAADLQRSLSEFFGCEIISSIDFAGGEFIVEGKLKNNGWKNVGRKYVDLYDIRVDIFYDTPRVTTFDLPFIGTPGEVVDLTLENAKEQIIRNLTTTKSKTIYENL